jgi:creatinine amidohydrolase
VRPTLYTQLLSDLALSILRAGFRRLFSLNGHGGNETPAAQALTELAAIDILAQQSLLALASWWSVGKPDLCLHNLKTPSISHAREYETSLILWLRPDLVNTNQAIDVTETINSQWLTGEKRVALFRRFAARTVTGGLGMPSAATPEKGKSILSAVVDEVVAFLEEFGRWPLLRALGPRDREK